MKDYIATDETLRSLLEPGYPGFPFGCYRSELEEARGRAIGLHWHKEVEFSLVLSGTLYCCDEINRYALTAGDGLFVNSGTLHRAESETGAVMVSMIFAPELIAPEGSMLYREFVEKLLNSDCSSICFRHDDAECAAVLRCLNGLYTASDRSFLSIRNAASLLWEELLAFTEQELTRTRSRVDLRLRARMQQMVQYIHRNYQRQIRLEEVAAAANISVSEALRCFHTSMHTTPVSYINQYRLERAKELLLSTSESVTGIAMSTGFENPSYFCRSFKKCWGTSPKRYREQHRRQGGAEAAPSAP